MRLPVRIVYDKANLVFFKRLYERATTTASCREKTSLCSPESWAIRRRFDGKNDIKIISVFSKVKNYAQLSASSSSTGSTLSPQHTTPSSRVTAAQNLITPSLVNTSNYICSNGIPYSGMALPSSLGYRHMPQSRVI